MKKKLLSMLLCVILTLMLLPVTALADGAEAKDGDFNGTIEWNAGHRKGSGRNGRCA